MVSGKPFVSPAQLMQQRLDWARQTVRFSGRRSHRPLDPGLQDRLVIGLPGGKVARYSDLTAPPSRVIWVD